MTQANWTIGALAREAGLHVQTLRYYEGEGLLTPAARTAGGQRRYGEVERRRLQFICHARDFGFPLHRIRELLALADAGATDCREIEAVARRQREAVRRRIDALQQLAAELDRMIDECDGGRGPDCRVLEVLGDHGECRGEHGASAEAGRGAPADGT